MTPVLPPIVACDVTIRSCIGPASEAIGEQALAGGEANWRKS